jgi:hypothetical protein
VTGHQPQDRQNPWSRRATDATRAPACAAHSVAVDASNNHIFVPLGANNVYPGCLTGCIAVFFRPSKVE